MKKLIIALSLALITTPIFGFLGVTGKVELDSNTKYVYRGIEKQNSFVLQPNASISAFGFRAKLFNNIVIKPDKNRKHFDETHFSLRYDFGAMGFSITPGFKYYANWEAKEHTAEVSLGISYTLLGLVGIYSTHYIDVIDDPGKYYGNIGAAFKFDFLPIVGVEGNMDLNWQKAYESSEFTFPYSINIGAAVKFKPIPLFYVKGHANATFLLTEKAKDTSRYKNNNIIYVGVAVGLEL